MKKIVFANQKGGVGKTAGSVHLSFFLEDAGYRVLHADLDAQGNSSKTLAERRSGFRAVDLFSDVAMNLPANDGITLFEASAELLDLDQQSAERMFLLRQQLAKLNDQFDYCVIDTPPALGFRMTAALIAADFVVSPIELDGYSIDGITKMITTVFGIKQKVNPTLEFIGMLANRFNPHSTEQKKAFDLLISKYPQFLIPAKIGNRTSITEALNSGMPVWRVKKSSAADAAKEMRHALGLIMEKVDS